MEDIGKGSLDLFKVYVSRAEGNAQDPYRIEYQAIEPEEESEESPFQIIPK